jgi:transcription initiation factor IIE alpha subunit
MPVDVQKEACIMDIKEKYGQLVVYLSVYSDELRAVLKKYEQLSEYVCSRCGTTKSLNFGGWLSFLCDDCAKELERR